MKYLAIIPLLIACRSDSKISVEPDDVVPQNTNVKLTHITIITLHFNLKWEAKREETKRFLN